MERKKIIAGNWKMNLNVDQAVHLVEELGKAGLDQEATTKLLIAPNYLALYPILELINHHRWNHIQVAAQDVHYESNGAFTGKISVEMLKAIGVRYSIVGHSEQRILFHETDREVSLKVMKLLKNEMIPLLCIGETSEERRTGRLEETLVRQLTIVLEGIKGLGRLERIAEKIIIAYEPVWAIGTGQSASAEEAEEAHQLVRRIIKKIFDEPSSKQISVLYGGSVTPDNAVSLFSMPNIDGALIGGASLRSKDFLTILKAR